jgi:hypothetical protein
MPGIVSQADAYIKRVVNTHLHQTGSLPSWLIDALKNSFPDLDFHSVRFANIVRWQFSLFEARCVLAGEADAIWEFPDGRWFIADYKMASVTQTQGAASSPLSSPIERLLLFGTAVAKESRCWVSAHLL